MGGGDRGTGDEPRVVMTSDDYDTRGFEVVTVWRDDGTGVMVRVDGKPFPPDSTK